METKKRVLIVDDLPEIGKIFGLHLKLAGYDVVSVTRGAEAIELVKNQKFDVMLLDVLMPELSGVDVLENIRSLPPIRVILFSALPEAVEIAKRYRVDGYISKPIYPSALIKKIKAVLGQTCNDFIYTSVN